MARKVKAIPDTAPANSYQSLGPDFGGLFLLLLCIITALALFGSGPGFLNEGLAALLLWLVGLVAYPLTFIGMGVSLLMIFRHRWLRHLSWARILVAELLLLCALGVMTFLMNPELSWESQLLQRSGGIIGRVVVVP